MPVPSNVFRANIHATVAGVEEMVHTLHFKRVNTVGTTEVTPQELANEIVSVWTGALTSEFVSGQSWAGLLRNVVVYDTVDVYLLNSAGASTEQAQALFGVTAKGTSTNVALPPECAVVASLKTGLPGRSNRGRLYTGGYHNQTSVVGGFLGNEPRAVIAKSLAAFGAGMKMETGAGADRINWVVLSRTAGTATTITEIKVGNVYDVQRRRQNGLAETFSSETITY